MKALFIVRGPFGVQKTEMAQAFCDDVISCWDYYEQYGENKFNPELKPLADKYCLDGVNELIKKGTNKIAVANSFSDNDDLVPFITLAKVHGYNIFSMISDNDITTDSRRDVPNEVVLQQMVKLKNNANYGVAVNYFLL